MPNKSINELRAELLQLSQNYLHAQYEANMKFYKEFVLQSLKSTEGLRQDLDKFIPPSIYTMDDVLKTARKLNKFIEHGA
jgi:hypothetical protein